ncbi:MAG: DUF6531 domain-containing protein, partial [Pseudonocardia sediminis]
MPPPAAQRPTGSADADAITFAPAEQPRVPGTAEWASPSRPWEHLVDRADLALERDPSARSVTVHEVRQALRAWTSDPEATGPRLEHELPALHHHLTESGPRPPGSQARQLAALWMTGDATTPTPGGLRGGASGFEGEIHGYAVQLPELMEPSDYDYVVRTPNVEIVLDTGLEPVLEIVTRPAAVVPGDTGRPSQAQVADEVRDIVHRLENAPPGARLERIFDGPRYEVEPTATDLRVRPVGSQRSADLYVHHSVGVPLAGLPQFMEHVLTVTRAETPKEVVTQAHLGDAMRVGRELARRIGEDPTYLASPHAGSRASLPAAEGFLATVYTQFAAMAQNVVSWPNLTKNYSAMGSRISMAELAKGLDPAVRTYLDTHRDEIARWFAKEFDSRDTAVRSVTNLLAERIPPRRANDAGRSTATIGGYLDSAFARNPERVIGQDEAMGIRTTIPELDTHRDGNGVARIDPPLAVMELRHIAERRQPIAEVEATHAAVVEQAQRAFETAQDLHGITTAPNPAASPAPAVSTAPAPAVSPAPAASTVAGSSGAARPSPSAQPTTVRFGTNGAPDPAVVHRVADQWVESVRAAVSEGRPAPRLEIVGFGNGRRFSLLSSHRAEDKGAERAHAVEQLVRDRVRTHDLTGLAPHHFQVDARGSNESRAAGQSRDDHRVVQMRTVEPAAEVSAFDGDAPNRPEAPRERAVPMGGRVVESDPIDMVTGEMVLEQLDLQVPGLVLRRTHVSSYRAGTLFGPSWASTPEQRLEIDERGVCFVGDDGVVLVYPRPVGTEVVWPVEGPRWPLRRATAGFELHTDTSLLRFARR